MVPESSDHQSSTQIVGWCRSVIESELEQDQVQPSSELRTNLRQASYLDKTESLVEANRSLIFTIDSGNHRVLAAVSRHVDECVHKFPPKTEAPSILPHVDRILHGKPVAGPAHDVAEPPECCDTNDITSVIG